MNKVSSKVELRFQVGNSALLTDEEKALINEKLGNYMNQEGFLQLVSQEDRSQLLNKEKSIKKFYRLLKSALTKPKARKATQPSQAAVEKRIAVKKKEGEKKASRKVAKGRLQNFSDEDS